MSDKKIRKIQMFEKYSKINDKLGDVINTDTRQSMLKDIRKPVEGKVKINVYDKFGRVIDQIEKENTVVKVGRNVLFQVASKIPYSVTTINGTNITSATNHVISHFTVGVGGAPSTSPFTPTPPSENDYKLTSPITISPGNILEPIDNKVFTSDPFGSEAIITMRFTLFIDYDQCNENSSLNPISEAGLVLTDSGNGSNPVMLSRLTFPSIPKTKDVAIEFYWYLYF